MSETIERPRVETVSQAMKSLQIGRAKLYEHINSGALESYMDDGRRKITSKSIDEFIERRIAQEHKRRGRAA